MKNHVASAVIISVRNSCINVLWDKLLFVAYYIERYEIYRNITTLRS